MAEKFKTVIIGGGFSGLNIAAALAEKTGGKNVAVLERNDRVGKKILATGNGRGNLTNSNLSYDNYYSGNKDFFKFALSKYGNKELIEYFEKLGLNFASDGDKMFPSSFQASSVLDLMRLKLEDLKVNVITDCFVKNVSEENGIFKIESGNGAVYAENVVFACGGSAGKQYGTDGSSYKLLLKFGHRLTQLYPSLVQLKTDTSLTKGLKGLKQDVNAVVYENGRLLKSARGELLFTEFGISGNAVFQLSGLAVSHNNVKFSVEFLPELSLDEVKAILKNKAACAPYLKAEDLLTGIINKQIGRVILKYCGQDFSAPVGVADTDKIAAAVKNFEIKITGSLGFDYAQVTKGGIEVSEVNDETFESRLKKNLYIIGEMLDVDGDCGGYNLQWAFSSAMCCADALGKKIGQ